VRLDELFFSHAARRPGHLAVVCGERRVTYAQLKQSIERLVRKSRVGERVALRVPNSIEFVEQAYAAWAAGAVVVPINTRLSKPEVDFILEEVRAPVESDAHDCLILYTSGTTGRPKGAVHTHAGVILQNLAHHVAAWGIGEDDRFLATTPLAHRAGIGRLVNALGLGGTLVVMEKFDAAEALALIERERITVAGLPPTVMRMMLPELKKNSTGCGSLRRVIVSTEAFPPQLMREVSALLPQTEFFGVYGMSEAAVSSASLAEQLARPGTVGRPLPGVQVSLEHGELRVRGKDVVMKGYFNQPAANAEALREGWFYTGELARQDAEGYLYIVDRKKDMVVTGGYNVYSKEVEQVLGQHPDIADAAVVGVPDALYGEAVAAFVQPRPGVRLEAQAVVEYCRTQLAGYKKPRHVVFVDSLPKNSLGKVLKSELRKRGVT
jgi:long-chain acyl-CoA synthetase